MANAHAKNHDYHILPLSPWPFIGSVSAFFMAVGAVMWMKKMTSAACRSVARYSGAFSRRSLHHVWLVGRCGERGRIG